MPVCLHGAPAVMSGIGEVLTPAPQLPEAGLVLVNPGVAVSTPSVFQSARRRFLRSRPKFPGEGVA